MNTPQLIPIDQISYDKDLQIRVIGCDPNHIDDLKEAIKEGADVPPIEVFMENEKYFIGDGNHRFLAYKLLKKKEIPCIISEGGRDAAFQRALGANAEHNALRRTNKDKRNAVKLAINKYPNMSARAIADMCKVTHTSVNRIRSEVEQSSTSITGKDGKSYPKFPTPRGEQLDFFDVINRSFAPAYEGLQSTLKNSVWTIEEVPYDDKLKALSEMKRNINELLVELRRYEKDFTTAKQKAQKA